MTLSSMPKLVFMVVFHTATLEKGLVAFAFQGFGACVHSTMQGERILLAREMSISVKQTLAASQRSL